MLSANRNVLGALAALALLVSCGPTTPRWFINCGGCGAPSQAPDGGWGPGTCTTQVVGATCAVSGETCSRSADPCVPVMICTEHDPAPSCVPIP